MEKEMYTRVLLGNLSIERLKLKIDKNITGANIDPIARQFLWQVGEDYGHGTGHGVGHFLNVHEGPHSISPKSNVPLAPGMVVTNEPGFYLKDKFGIRIENMLLVVKNNINENFLTFENVTRVHYETNLIKKELLNEEFRVYINSYNKMVYENIAPILEDKKDQKAIEYLKKKV